MTNQPHEAQPVVNEVAVRNMLQPTHEMANQATSRQENREEGHRGDQEASRGEKCRADQEVNPVISLRVNSADQHERNATVRLKKEKSA